MNTGKSIWTALPNGFDDRKRPRASVQVAPRLGTDDGDTSVRTLGDYPIFVEWPKHVVGLRFRVEFDNGVVAEAIPESKPDVDLWRRILPPETPVRPHVFKDHAKRNLHVFPVHEVLNFVQQTYVNLLVAGPDLPSIDGPNALTTAFGPLEIGRASCRERHEYWV